MKLILAPMEGVIDPVMRDLLTRQNSPENGGGYDLCITEFVRVVDQLYPPKYFHRLCPELKKGGTTPSGVPVRVQLLGQNPDWMAENAVRAIELGSPGIDLNFGCPAKTVNRHKGGSILLKTPETVYQIIKKVRDAVPQDHEVSAKIRLGYEDKSLALENAAAVEAAGATSLAIHARTKLEGYKPPAHWHWIRKIKDHVNLPIIANGEIWSQADAQECQQESGCTDLMLGRGALALPNLAAVIKGQAEPLSWSEVVTLLVRFGHYDWQPSHPNYYQSRIKQWFRYLKTPYPQAGEIFPTLRKLKNLDEIIAVLEKSVTAGYCAPEAGHE